MIFRKEIILIGRRYMCKETRRYESIIKQIKIASRLNRAILSKEKEEKV